jgi:hypothetical protein
VIWLNDPPTANAGVDQAVLEKTTVTLDGVTFQRKVDRFRG